MDLQRTDDAVIRRIIALVKRVDDTVDAGLYFYNQPISELRGGGRSESGGSGNGDVCVL